MYPLKKIKLENGLRVILASQPGSLTTTVLTLVEAGSKYETKEINGLSHFLEHMCFKGTKNRPRPIDISGELDSLGAEYNAFTSKEYTGYFVKSQAEKLDKALEIVADLYSNPLFDSEEINKERGVVIEEMNMYDDLPMRRVNDVFMELLYGNQPAGWPIDGRKEVIKDLKRDDFLRYQKNHYVAKATVVAVAGAFQEKELLEKIKFNFSSVPSAFKNPKIITKEEQFQPAAAIQFKKSDQTHLVLGVRAFDIHDERRFALQVLADILGGGMSSRLFQKVRGELGAAYYVRAEADFYTDHGYLAVSAGVNHKKVNEVIAAILNEFKIIGENVSAAELQRAKDHLIGNSILGLETSDELALFYGGQEIIKGEIVSFEEVFKKIKSVAISDIQKVAQEIFRNDKLNLALIGPFKNGQFDALLKL